MDRPFRSPTGWQPTPQAAPPAWQGEKPVPEATPETQRPRPSSGFDRLRVPVARGPRTGNVDAYLAEIEKLRKLVEGDDSWLDALSKEELIALRDRARMLAGNLSKVQDQLRPFKRFKRS